MKSTSVVHFHSPQEPAALCQHSPVSTTREQKRTPAPLTIPAFWNSEAIALIFRALPSRSIRRDEFYSILDDCSSCISSDRSTSSSMPLRGTPEPRLGSFPETMFYHFCAAIDAMSPNPIFFGLSSDGSKLIISEYYHTVNRDEELSRLLNRKFILNGENQALLKSILRSYSEPQGASTEISNEQLTPETGNRGTKRIRTPPREEGQRSNILLHFADALQEQATQTWADQSREQPQKTTCIISFRDAVRELQLKYPEQSEDKLSKAFHQLAQLVPAWLRFQPTTLLLISPSVDYAKDIRQQISTESSLPIGIPSTVPENVCSTPKSTSAFPTVVSVESVDKSNSSCKRRFQNDDNHDTTHASQPQRELLESPTKRLRVNPNLIFTDADHMGGEILERNNTSFDSPRGLRKLFLLLNAGERI